MLTAFLYSTQTGDRRGTIRDLEWLFGGSEQCLACFSVRSALDLFLSVMQFPEGSEILVTAINIPDMVVIIEHHGLIIVPVDVDINTLSPGYEAMAALVSQNTVAILTAHIYGRWTNMNAVVRIAKECKLFLLEDCAESFSGLSDLGHPESDLALFSFGAIKYTTALGGGIVRVKDQKILSAMRARLQTYPIFAESSYVERLFRYSIVMFLTNNPLVTMLGVRFLNFFGVDYKETIVSLLRGFPGNIIAKIRYQPSTSLLRMMLRQLQQFDPKEHAKAKLNGDFVLRALLNDFLIPGSKSDTLNYWLFPILVDNPKDWVKDLEKEKIEAYCGVTQLDLVKPKCLPTDCCTKVDSKPTTSAMDNSFNSDSNLSNEQLKDMEISKTHSSKPGVGHEFGVINHENPELYPHQAKFLMDHVLYLPVHKRIPTKDLKHLCYGILKVAQSRRSDLLTPKQLLLNQLRSKL